MTLVEIGEVISLFRYPVKSMGGQRLEAAMLGLHGLEGDRRLALRRLDDNSGTGFPWLTASRLPELLLFTPQGHTNDVRGEIPTHVRTPDGPILPIFGAELAAEIERRHGAPVQMMHIKHGIYDEACVSVIATDTVLEIARLSGHTPDVRRFRPNVVVRLSRAGAFLEDEWVGGSLSFGNEHGAPAVAVILRDLRCAMLNFDPDTAEAAPKILKAVVRVHQNTAGIYGTVTRVGQLTVGQKVYLRPPDT